MTAPSSPPPVIVGAGLAGLVVSLALPGPSTVICPFGPDGTTSSELAQGGIAVAVDEQDVGVHVADTLAAGAGLCDADAVETLAAGGTDAMAFLEACGVRFDRTPEGRVALALEAAHSRPRIRHVAGDRTGAAVHAAVRSAVERRPDIEVIDGTVTEILTDIRGRVCGAAVNGNGDVFIVPTSDVVLASGGLGGLFTHTTNPASSWGAGIALGVRAGARVRDLEMIQFHPTALAVDSPGTLPLISEAVRGAGARLVDDAGVDLLDDPLAPRDVVARAVHTATLEGRGANLDTVGTLGHAIENRFPGVTAACRANGIDPVSERIPVRPAAHFAMGGLATDVEGRTAVPGLWAIGECASTGVHGANRLASNSLLECVVFGLRVARALASQHPSRPAPTATPAGRPIGRPPALLRAEVERTLGIFRTPESVSRFRSFAGGFPDSDPHLVAWLIASSALRRHESRGAHTWASTPTTSRPGVHTHVEWRDVVDPQRRIERTAS